MNALVGRPTLVVMAAGLGVRYGGAKQFDGIGPAGETLIEYAAFDARRAGFGRLVCVIGPGAEGAFACVARRLPPALGAVAVIQDPGALPAGAARPPGRTKPWGTAHAVLAARAAIDAPFAVQNADDFYGRGAYELAIETCSGAGAGEAVVMGLPLERTLSAHGPVTRAICEIDAGGRLARIEEVSGIERSGRCLQGRTGAGETRRLSGRELASMNFWVLPPAVFDRLEERFGAFLVRRGFEPDSELTLPDAIGELVAGGALRVRAREVPGPWFGLTHARDRGLAAEALLAMTERGAYPSPLR